MTVLTASRILRIIAFLFAFEFALSYDTPAQIMSDSVATPVQASVAVQNQVWTPMHWIGVVLWLLLGLLIVRRVVMMVAEWIRKEIDEQALGVVPYPVSGDCDGSPALLSRPFVDPKLVATTEAARKQRKRARHGGHEII